MPYAIQYFSKLSNRDHVFVQKCNDNRWDLIDARSTIPFHTNHNDGKQFAIMTNQDTDLLEQTITRRNKNGY